MMKVILAGLILLELALFQPRLVEAAVITPVATTVVQNPAVNVQNAVIIQNSQFIPSVIQVTPGTIVTWINQDSISHTTISDSSTGAESWDSGNIGPGQSYSRTFTQVGTYTYHCNLHPAIKGSVQVVPAGTVVQPVSATIVPSTQLPGTGVPLAAYSVVALIPVGWKLIKYKRELTEDKSARGLWQKRQFNIS
ncbi:MAG: plastocyanin/azurin family copper-binding protein [Candidatus Daviesbacteria bacterium]|nr:plastocyanin/azurin family copper-binding protein [Candidatus Daviesbacteria bacterium]